MMKLNHYPYRFVMKDVQEWRGIDTFMSYRLLYSFKSTKTNQTYWAWVEAYKHHFYAVKFHLKNHRDSDYKYNVMTGLNEARQCINTVMAIMYEIADKDPYGSFGFIGANMIDESEVYTKRFRVYQRFMQSYFGRETYEHFFNIEKSAYMLLSRKQLEREPDLAQKLLDGFVKLYPYFD